MTATVAGWISYAAARGDTVADDVDSAAALVRATDYVTFHYVSRFAAGYDLTSPNVDEAIYEAAKLELAKPGFFNKTFTPAEQKVLVQVDSIRRQPVGDMSGSVAAMPVSAKIEAMLRPYMVWPIGAFPV